MQLLTVKPPTYPASPSGFAEAALPSGALAFIWLDWLLIIQVSYVRPLRLSNLFYHLSDLRGLGCVLPCYARSLCLLR
jgi:hypothetical protein